MWGFEKAYENRYRRNILHFLDGGHLTKHLGTHSGENLTHTISEEKPYQCKLCTQSFGQCGDLKKHVRTYTGEKPYQCKYCTKSFSDGGHLTKHLRTHSEEKLYTGAFGKYWYRPVLRDNIEISILEESISSY